MNKYPMTERERSDLVYEMEAVFSNDEEYTMLFNHYIDKIKVILGDKFVNCSDNAIVLMSLDTYCNFMEKLKERELKGDFNK